MRDYHEENANVADVEAWSQVAAGKTARTESIQRTASAAPGGDVVQLKSESANGEAAANDAFSVHVEPRPMLSVGSRGPAVVELQEKLGITADGAFGPKTRAAVVAFQQQHGLAADGIVGAKTWAALDGKPAPEKTAAEKPAADTPAAEKTTADKTTTTADKQPVDEKPATSGNAARDAIVAQARSKLGLIFSNKSGGVDETGEKTRHGYEHLIEIFGVALPSFPEVVIKYLKYGKNSDATNKNGLPSWCGIFATWAVMTGGGNCGGWQSGNRVDNLKKLTKDPRPGDVGNFEKNNHYCIIAAVNGDTIETIDGNSFDGETGGDGAVATKTRNRSEFRAFYRQVDE